MRRWIRCLAVAAVGAFFVAPLQAQEGPILVGLDADLSSGSARSGESIRRGAQLAMDEINAGGGVLGRKLELVARDHRGNPARGIDNIHDFAAMDSLVAVMGGLHTPVAMKELKAIHQHRLPFLVPWAAGTPLVDNGFTPNYVFRVSVRDQFAGGFLVKQALNQGYQKIGLLLERTGWGRSNQKAMTSALQSAGLEPALVEWFHWGDKDFQPMLDNLKSAGVEAILLVANAPEGKQVVMSMAQRSAEQRLPILSHWGITGGDFHQTVGDLLDQVDLQFLQTYSFLKPTESQQSQRLISAYCDQYGCNSAATPERAIFAPVGTAHAYDLIHLMAQALEQSGKVDRVVLQQALQQLPAYQGLVRHYNPPFTEARHDALTAEDFRMARYAKDGAIVPE